MNQETKTTAIPDKPAFDLKPLIDDKTLLLYKADQKKAFIYSLRIGGIVAVVMCIAALAHWRCPEFDEILLVSFVVAFVSCFILMFRLDRKYGIKNTYNYNVDNASCFSKPRKPYRSISDPFRSSSSNYYSPSTNPSTGLPMSGGGMDFSGTPYGCHRN